MIKLKSILSEIRIVNPNNITPKMVLKLWIGKDFSTNGFSDKWSNLLRKYGWGKSPFNRRSVFQMEPFLRSIKNNALAELYTFLIQLPDPNHLD